MRRCQPPPRTVPHFYAHIKPPVLLPSSAKQPFIYITAANITYSFFFFIYYSILHPLSCFVGFLLFFLKLLRCHKSKLPGKGGWQETIQLASEAANKTSLMRSSENLSEVMLFASLQRTGCKVGPELCCQERAQVARAVKHP